MQKHVCVYVVPPEVGRGYLLRQSLDFILNLFWMAILKCSSELLSVARYRRIR